MAIQEELMTSAATHTIGVGFLLSTVAVILTVYYLFQQQTHFYKLGNKIPGPWPLPYIGNALMVLFHAPEDVLSKALEYSAIYNGIARAWLGSKLYVFISKPEDIEIILSSHEHIDKSKEYRYFKPWLGDGLLISTGDRWRSHRKMIAPTFHMSILKTFIPIFHRNSLQVVEKLKKKVGKTFDVHDDMSAATVDILLETAMGIRRSNPDDAGYDYAMAVMKMCDIIHKRHYQWWLRSDLIFKLTKMAGQQVKLINIIHSLTKKVIKSKKSDYAERKKEGTQPSIYEEIIKNNDHVEDWKKELQEREKITGFNNGALVRDDLDDNDENDVGEKKRLAFLDFMIEASHQNGSNLNDTDIKEEVDTIMFEGHDTTAAGSSFALCLLAEHQDIQEKVMEEINEIFKGSDRAATYQDTLNMKYLERVIMETLRMYPPVPIIAREIKEDVKFASEDYTAPAGCTVVVATLKLHRRPELYPDPMKFNPDRFLPENCQNRHYYSYVPFSAGPRSCVGRKYAMLKLKVLLSTILRHYKMVGVVKEKDFRLQGDIILKRTDGFRIKIEERVKSN